MYRLIMCADLEWNIGKDGRLLYFIPDDLRNFKEKTYGHALIMGRKTFDSLPGILPRRLHLVLTQRKGLMDNEHVKYFNSVDEINSYVAANELTPWVIGGAEIIRLFLPYIGQAYITRVLEDQSHNADTKMHAFDEDPEWKLIESSHQVIYESLERDIYYLQERYIRT